MNKNIITTELSKISPHKTWLSIMEDESYINRINGLSNRLRALDYEKAMNIYAEEIVPMAIEDGANMQSLNNSISVWYPLATGTEFIIDLDSQQNKLLSYMEKLDTEIKDKSITKRFDYHFEDIIITFQKGKMYLPYFISVFKMLEKYINKQGEQDNIYLIKMCTTANKGESKLLKSKLPVLFEFQYIKSLFTKLIISCKTGASTCNNLFNPDINIMLFGKKMSIPNYWCMKSWNTCESCPQRNTSLSELIIDDERYARQVYEVFKIVCFVLDRYNNRRTIEVQASSDIRRGHHSIGNISATESGQRVIKITTISRHYESKGDGSDQHGHHESPVEHIRHEHYRHLHNGKVIEIKEAIVNKGNIKKPVYKITE